MNSQVLPNATSSLGSASGVSHSGAQVGQTTGLFGPDPVLASLSPRQARELGFLIHATCGQTLPGTSTSVALQSSLENKLRVMTQALGSTLYTLTWKPWVTPLGPSRSRLRASARRISEIGSILSPAGWPTPAASDHKGGYQGGRIRNGKLSTDRLDVCAQIATGGRLTVSGGAQTGWSAATGNNVQLDPGLSRWLMGLPPEWCALAPTETPSMLKRRKSS